MKSRSCGLVQRIGAADSATPHPDPSGGQAPALHSPLPTLWIPAFAGMTNWGAGMTRVGIYSRTNGTHETGPPKSEQLPKPSPAFHMWPAC